MSIIVQWWQYNSSLKSIENYWNKEVMRFVCTFHYLHFDEFWEHDIIIWLFISDDVFLLKASREFIRDDLMSFIQGNNKDGRDILIRFPPLLSLKMITSVIEMMIRVGRSKCWSMMVTGKPMEKTWMSANNKNLKSLEKQSKLRRIKIMMIIIIAIIVVIIIHSEGESLLRGE